MPNAGQFTDLRNWGAFKIPVFGFAFVVALLSFRNIGMEIEYIIIVRFTVWALGASVISYGHSIFYSTHCNRTGESDLPMLGQIFALSVHVIWFGCAIFFLPPPPVST